MTTTFGFRKLFLIGFKNIRTLHDNGINGLQNARFLQLDRDFALYKLGIPALSKEYSCGPALLYYGKLCDSENESRIGVVSVLLPYST